MNTHLSDFKLKLQSKKQQKKKMSLRFVNYILWWVEYFLLQLFIFPLCSVIGSHYVFTLLEPSCEARNSENLKMKTSRKAL